MKQVLQNMRTGETRLTDVPPPQVGRNEVLMATKASLISAGTERMVMDFAQKSLLGKAQERPDLVKKVMDKLQRDGVVATVQSVFSKLEEPLPLGYSAAGEVVEVGAGLERFYKPGDRVVMAGAGYANHAELNSIPKNLVAHLPEGVPYEHGAFATLTAIAMQGFRNARVGLGDRVLVMGLGLVGQLTVQLAANAGCRVFGVDYAPDRVELALKTGAEAAHTLEQGPADGLISEFTQGKGFDAIIICAATDSNDPLQNAARWSRDKARVVMTGKVGTTVPYADFMKKELEFIISRSYGPGRYDPSYEQKGQEYPIGFVRWTERENLAEAARLMATGGLDVESLISHTYPIENALEAYTLVKEKSLPSLGVVLTYPATNEERLHIRVSFRPTEIVSGEVGLGLLGSGGFARGVLLPALKGMPEVKFTGIVSKGGATAQAAGERFGFNYASGSASELLADKTTSAVIIATRHDTHAELVIDALEAGKHVFVEKPLALTLAELEQVEQVYKKAGRALVVGFNRRFAPFTQAMIKHFNALGGPRQVVIRVNAGKLESDNWQTDPETGGGRLLGELCHFIDLALCLGGGAPHSLHAVTGEGQDVYALTITFTDGSVAQISYTSEGDSSFSKERVEIYGSGSVGVIENFNQAFIVQAGKKKKLKTPRQDKGHHNELVTFLRAVRGEEAAGPLAEAAFTSSRVTLLAAGAAREGGTVMLG